MNSIVKFSLAAAIAAAPALADENFGGIGVTIYQVPAGVYVAVSKDGTLRFEKF